MLAYINADVSDGGR